MHSRSTRLLSPSRVAMGLGDNRGRVSRTLVRLLDSSEMSEVIRSTFVMQTNISINCQRMI